MKKAYSLFVLLLIVISIAEFYASNHFLRGYLRSKIYVAKELKSPPDSLNQFRIATESPFKYRVVFPALVKGTNQLLFNGSNEGFFPVYKTWSLIFYVSSALSLFALLCTTGFTPPQSFLGSCIFLSLPAMVLAYTLPVHTREDTLAYTLLFLGLIFLIKNFRLSFLSVCVLGVFTRETLLLLPIIYLLFSKDQNFTRRFLLAGTPIVLWITIRIAWPSDQYDVWLGLRWNMSNLDQVAGFLFITFNVLWIPYFIHLSFYKRHLTYTPQDLRFFYNSSIIVLVILILTTFVGGIFNEIRLLQLFAPWIIVISLNFARNYWSEIIGLVTSKAYLTYATTSLAFCVVLMYFTLRHQEFLLRPGKFAVPYDLWIALSIFYLFVFLLVIPPSARIFSLKQSRK